MIIKHNGREIFNDHVPVPTQNRCCGCSPTCNCTCGSQMFAEAQPNVHEVHVNNIPQRFDLSHMSVITRQVPQPGGVHVSVQHHTSEQAAAHPETEIHQEKTGPRTMVIRVLNPQKGQQYHIQATHGPSGQTAHATTGNIPDILSLLNSALGSRVHVISG